MTDFFQAPDALTLAAQLADRVTEQINQSVAQRDRAIVAFSGGSTPKPLFQVLCGKDIDWAKVLITLVDERWVPSTHELSNAAFLHTNLLSALPQAHFISLYRAADSVKDSVDGVLNEYLQATSSSAANPAPFDVVVLGMGSDGHTASFFPDADNIQELVDPERRVPLQTCESATTQVPRVTWSLNQLLTAKLLTLHFTGADKRLVYERALGNDNALELPIRAAIHQDRTPLQVYYAD